MRVLLPSVQMSCPQLPTESENRPTKLLKNLSASGCHSEQRLRMRDSAVLSGLFALTVALLWLGGAFTGAFGGESDEPSHYVTGLMIRDYLAAGLPGDPVAFAKKFYLQYPNVAFGLWPPVYHIFSGVWMLVFGTGRISIMLMLASVTAAWALLFYTITRKVAGRTTAVVSAVLLVTLPATQAATASVMLDVGLAIAMLGAMAAYARYLQSERMKDACLFGVWAAGALLIKYNALALALVPPISILLTGRHHLWRTRSFWTPAAVVLVAAGPWYIVMRHFVQYAAEPGEAWPPVGRMLADNLMSIALLAGPVVFALAAVGAVLACLSMRGRVEQNTPLSLVLYVVSTATVLAIWLFHGVVYPIHSTRYLLSAAPAVLLLASVPLRHFMHDRHNLSRAMLALGGVAYAAFTFTVPQKKTSSWVEVADAVLAHGVPRGGAVLVSADGAGEGMLVAEIAMRDSRPNYFILRANKMLASQTLMGADYKQRYQTPVELMRALDAVPVSMAVVQPCSPKQCAGHEKLVAETARQLPERWRLLSVTTTKDGSPIQLYRIAGNEGKPARAFSLDMSHTIGGTLEKR